MSEHIDVERVRARAKVLAGNDRDLRRDLIEVRRSAGLTQSAVAEMMGCTQQAIQKLERYDADPKLSTLSRYANAIGALIYHQVEVDHGQSIRLAEQPRTHAPRHTFTTMRVPVNAPGSGVTATWVPDSPSSFALAGL